MENLFTDGEPMALVESLGYLRGRTNKNIVIAMDHYWRNVMIFSISEIIISALVL